MEATRTNIFGDIIYDWKVIDYKDIDIYEGAIENVYHRNFIGLLIKNVLPQDDVQELLKNLPKVPDEHKINRQEVTIYPRGFAAYLDNQIGTLEEGMDVYLENGKKYVESFVEYFKVDFHAKLKAIFEKFGSGRTYEFLPGLDGEGYFTPSQFRAFLPHENAIPVHCGNVFHEFYKNFYARLSQQVVIQNQMSYFVMLQKPEENGELVLFDMLFEKGQEMIPFQEIRMPDGSVVNPIQDPNMKKMNIDPQPGDMIIFSGGEVWHWVRTFLGAKPRITLGGFFSFSNDGKKIHSWA